MTATFNLADMFELTADLVPDREPLVAGDRRVTYRELEDRSNRLAHALAARGVGAGDNVGVYAHNCAEWVEALLATFKLRAVPVNVNHRYVDDELAFLFDNADLVALVFQREFAPRVAAVRALVPELRSLIVIDDGSGAALDGVEAEPYETVLEAASPVRDFAPRSSNDHYILYTGGTTGLPKGVVWRHVDFFYACLQGGAGAGAPAAEHPGDLAARAVSDPPVRVMLVAGPMHHASGQWGMISSLLMGARVVLYTGRRFDGHEMWELVEREGITKLGLVGDAMARPLADALAEGRADGSRYDASTLIQIGSGGAILSASVQQQLRELLPGIELADVMGSSESGLFAFQTLDASDMAPGAQPRFALDAIATVLGDDQQPVIPGSGVIGRLACRGHVPIGYLKDTERTAATFPLINGERWVVPGDFATLEADGSIRLLGRGSVCINTGGEKVFPEEVEAVVKAHPAVFDAVIVGVPDARFGERITAVVQPRSGHTLTLADLDEHCRTRLAAYKVPRELHLVDEVVRHSSGKPDYRWASTVANTAHAAETMP